MLQGVVSELGHKNASKGAIYSSLLILIPVKGRKTANHGTVQ